MNSNFEPLLRDFVLVAGFGIQHSFLAMVRVKRSAKRLANMDPLAWRSIESVSNILYVLAAAALWEHVPVYVWNITHPVPKVLMSVLFCLSWIWYWYLHLVEYDCGLAFGSTTLVAKLSKVDQPQLINWTVGSRRWIRFPVHTAFFGMFFFIPGMTQDLFVLAVTANIYNVIGSVFYDRRLVHLIEESWQPYVALTGLIWPPVYRNPAGASTVVWPTPRHWRRPVAHLPGLIVGVMIGTFYYMSVGGSPSGWLGSITALCASLLASVVGGALLGWSARRTSKQWGQAQTDLSTTVALASAAGVVTWVIESYLRERSIPSFGLYLSMWFTVQYLGHVVAYSVAPRKWRAVESSDGDARPGTEMTSIGGRD